MAKQNSIVTVHGMPELLNSLKAFPKNVERKVLRQALRASMKPVQKKAKELAPVESGALKRAVRIRAGKRKRNVVSINVQIGANDKQFTEQYYAGFQELGAPARNIPPKGYLRQAFEETKQESVAKAEKMIIEGIDREAAKLMQTRIDTV